MNYSKLCTKCKKKCKLYTCISCTEFEKKTKKKHLLWLIKEYIVDKITYWISSFKCIKSVAKLCWECRPKYSAGKKEAKKIIPKSDILSF